MNSQDDEEVPFLFQVIFFPFQLALLILFIAFTLLTFGIFLPEDNESKPLSSADRSIEEQLQIELGRKRSLMRQVHSRIAELELIVNKIKRNERRLLFCVRLIITAVILAVNIAYLKYVAEIDFESIGLFGKTSSTELPDLIEKITNFNAMILLLYSVPAYLLYGTVGRFTAAMKSKTTTILRRKHIPSFSELQYMRQEEKQLSQDIRYIEMRLREFGWNF